VNDDDLDVDPPYDEPVEEPSEAEPDNVADRRHRERKEKRIARQKREGAQFWRGVLATEVGRREVWGILRAGHWTETRFSCGPNGFPQTEATWFAAGEQALAQRFHDTLDIIDHEGLYLMKTEHDPRYADANPLRKKEGA
jgi:hypothetical protein